MLNICCKRNSSNSYSLVTIVKDCIECDDEEYLSIHMFISYMFGITMINITEYAEVLPGQDRRGYVQSTFSGWGDWLQVLSRIVSRVDSVVAQPGMLLLYWKFIMHIEKGILIFQVYQCKIYWLNTCKKKERKHWLLCYGLNDFICSLIKCVVLTYFLSLLNLVFWPQTGWQNSTCWVMKKLGVIFL